MSNDRSNGKWHAPAPIAGNGLLDRRTFLSGGAAFAATLTGYSLVKPASAEPLADDPWSKVAGNLWWCGTQQLLSA